MSIDWRLKKTTDFFMCREKNLCQFVSFSTTGGKYFLVNHFFHHFYFSSSCVLYTFFILYTPLLPQSSEIMSAYGNRIWNHTLMVYPWFFVSVWLSSDFYVDATNLKKNKIFFLLRAMFTIINQYILFVCR